MLRRVAIGGAVLALVSLVATSAGAERSAVPGEASCRKAEIRQHNEAVFGHFSTRAAAEALMKSAAQQGFRGIKVEDDGCGDFEVEIDGADTQKDRSSFAEEAGTAGFQVTFEQTAWPMQFKEGEVVGVFATKQRLRDANALMAKLAARGFRYIDIVRTSTRWLVVMPQVPVKHALPISREVARAGFQIRFAPGVKPGP